MRHLLLILFGALGCPNPPEEQQKDCIDHLAVLYLNGNKDEALEAAEKVLKTGIKNEKKDYLNESPLTVFSHAFLARIKLNARDAERLFELAATKFQKTGKIKEASISYAVLDPENWTGALALESPWWGGILHGTDQEGSRGGIQGQGGPGIGAR